MRVLVVGGAGFTLLELLGVTILLGVLAVSATPMLQRGWTHLLAERTVYQLAQSLRTAHLLAVSRAQPVDWFWDPREKRVGVRGHGEDGSTGALPDRLASPQRLPDPIRVTVVREGEPARIISFFPDGTSQSTILLIGPTAFPWYEVTVHEATSQVVVQRTGVSAH